MLITNGAQETMFTQRGFDLNSVYGYTDSLKEAFKHTMLKQEVIFRNQVNELHRLYGVQILLTKELGCKEFDRCTSWKNNMTLSLMPLRNPLTDELQLKETRISSIPMVGKMQPIKQELPLGHEGMDYKIQQRPVDHQLPADLYIRHADKDFTNKENVSGHLKNTMESHVGNISDAVDLTLSLSLGEDNKRREGNKKIWFDKKNLSCPQAVIDLEDSTERIFSGELEQGPSLGFTASTTYSVAKHQSYVSVLSDPAIPRNVKEDKCHEIGESSSLVDDSECCQEQHFLGQEFKESQSPCNHMPVKKPKEVTSYEAMHMDLNQVHHDDSSCYSNDITVVHPSTASSSGGFSEKVSKDKEGFCPTTIWRKEINDCSTSDILQHEDTDNIALANSSGKAKRAQIRCSNSKLIGIDETKASLIDLESVSRLPMDLCEDHGSCGSDSKTEEDKFTSERQGGHLNDLNHTCLVSRKLGCEKSEVEDTAYLCSDQSQDSSKNKHGNKSSASWDSSSIVDNVSSSTKIIQSGIDSAYSSILSLDQVSGIHEQSHVAILSGGQNQRSSDSNESIHKCFNEKEESAKVDTSMQRAAESLIQISLLNFACSQDCSTRSGSNEVETEENEQPQNSSDSFELISLKLTESNPDDYCVSSKPFEINDLGKKDVGIKLRRGRRMKDFQKDILPVLTSLSRHEIYEDISILEGVLRSKEYRKNRARMGDGESWCLPSRSRRTRLNYIRRRNFS